MDLIAVLVGLIPADIFTKLGTIFTWVTAIVTGASAIVALTPTPKDDAILGKIRGVLEFLALNVFHAKK
jgi:hypothetical protein